MKVIQLASNPAEAALKAAETLRSGGIILYPTDTLYGLGADAFSDSAVDAIYAIKGRDTNKPIHAVCADLQMIEQYAELTDAARLLAEKFLPGALTLVLKKKSGVEGGIARGMSTIGVRIPDNAFCLEAARVLGRPFTATSANAAGERVMASVSGIIKQIGNAAENISIAIDAGELPARLPSTVVDASSEDVQILREGAIQKSAIEAALKAL